jgi:hypothetical protein
MQQDVCQPETLVGRVRKLESLTAACCTLPPLHVLKEFHPP